MIQGHKDKKKIDYPDLIKKNIVMKVPDNKVNLLSEFIAAKDDAYNELFTPEVLEKMKTFVYE